ncbi:threonine/serine exporter family protein [Asaccharospora irregularis]|uniref:Uncharacterized membrane protein YjjP, DUF1212 family n=1 Tax=Asaccharospora irregularis DSM 2635 TaxID=1121321 RepID=A0A1M5J6I6_9FIRM|nr:threonine/serine exporter family protein [Asaccharospora irregularis]SHG35975.1 Uncharacterized membrane protein YjjP, DUF1212 family [Asaccharospora irregularis DSM 2635]
MANDFNKNYKENVLRFSLLVGEQMLASGAETYRVEDTIIRICKSRGFKHVNVFTAPTVIIISDEKFDGLCFMKTIKIRSINLDKISLLNSLSREFVGNAELSIEEATERLNEIKSRTPYPKWFLYCCTGLASASFACLVGGTHLIDFLLTFLIAILAVIVFDKIMRLSGISTFSTLVSSFLIAVSGVLLTEIGILSTPKMLIVGSIMPLLPGVSFIKGLRDLISGDLLSGIARSFDAGMIAIAIASGVGFVLDVWFRMGGVF